MTSQVPGLSGHTPNRLVRFYNYPVSKPHALYEEAVERVVGTLRKADGLVSVFQLGSVGSPGISDLDVLAVFEDGVHAAIDPLKDLPRHLRYPFTHSLFGICRSHFYDAQQHTFFHNYNLLWGEKLFTGPPKRLDSERDTLQRQVALEFLLARYISMTIEATYGASSLRNLLLSTHALRYDLEFLNVDRGPFYDLVHRLVNWRSVWFEQHVGKEEITAWWREFYPALQVFLTDQVERHHLYLPEWTGCKYSRNVLIRRAGPLSYNHNGFPVPSWWIKRGKKAARIQHRFNSFIFNIPYIFSDAASAVDGRFRFLRDHIQYNQDHFRHLGSVAGNFSKMLISGS